jgi:hypothetical protein
MPQQRIDQRHMPLARLGTRRALGRAPKQHRPSLQGTAPAKEPRRKPLLQQRTEPRAWRLVEPWLVEQERADFRRLRLVSALALAPKQ